VPHRLAVLSFAAVRPAPFRYAACFAHGPADTSCVGARQSVARPFAGVRAEALTFSQPVGGPLSLDSRPDIGHCAAWYEHKYPEFVTASEFVRRISP
jgi:hypothetical protein